MSHLTGNRYSPRGVILEAKPYGTMRYGGKANGIECNASYTSRKQMGAAFFSRRGSKACTSKQKIISVMIIRKATECDEQKQTKLRLGTEQ
ncbi:jg18473 [Pararge aegeria aegeria]|uniref:Jg18473 protein n=1 Tax=Pararge aegeria aegeria TaxID=348720 RepID=A0A8S4RL56_9NEOP|nr:jg18473 [Pararge aegeria aegeria]